MNNSVLFVVFFVAVGIANGQDENRMEVEVTLHRPCNTDFDNQILTISGDSPISKIADSPGCYELPLDVNTTDAFSLKDLQFFVDARSTEKEEDRHSCHISGSNGCGGIGSCLYCNPCEILDSDAAKGLINFVYQEKNELGEWGEVKDGLDCEEKVFEPSEKKIALKFCAPTKKEFLDHFKIDNDIFELTKRVPLYLTIYLYNRPVDKQLQLLRYIQEAHIKATNQADYPDYLEFGHIAADNSGGLESVGCHKVVAELFIK